MVENKSEINRLSSQDQDQDQGQTHQGPRITSQGTAPATHDSWLCARYKFSYYYNTRVLETDVAMFSSENISAVNTHKKQQ